MKRLVLAVIAVLMVLPANALPAVADAPAVGMCFSYSKEQWVQTEFTAALVNCSSAHNGEVLGQVTVPEDIAAQGYASRTVKGWAFRACQPIAVDYAWSKTRTKYPKASYVMPRTARLNVHYPSAADWAAGARWAACLGQSRNKQLTQAVPRTGSVKARGLKPHVCMNPRTWAGTKCSKPDAVTLTHQVWIPSSYATVYPGTTRMLKRTQKACQRLRKKGWTLRTWFVPGLAAWERGNRYGFCELVR